MKSQDSSKAVKHFYEFGPFRIDLEERLLSSNQGETIPLAPKIFETLILLIENKGRIVTKDEIMKRLWPDRYVEESNVAQNIFMLRKLLGESPGNQYIENIPRRGYRFVGIVTEAQEEIEQTVKTKEEIPAHVEEPARPDEPKISIAVLPMANESGNSDWDYLADGVTDSLIRLLSHLPRVRVIARSLVYRYKGKEVDALEIGRELSADMVLVSRVVAPEGKLIIRAELVEVSTGWRAWGEQYQPQLSDIRKLEDELSTSISKKLHLKLTNEQKERLRKQTEEEKKRLSKHETDNAEAYQAFLMGRYYRSRRTGEGYEKAIEFFEEAIQLDPNYALAYSALADSYVSYDFYGILPPWETSKKAKTAAIEALAIDDTLAEAHTALACVKMMYERDWSNAEREFKRAIELDPEFAHAHNWYSHFLMAMGRIDESFAESQIALKLDPLDDCVNQFLGWHYHYARQFDRAIAQLEKTLELNPDFFLARVTLGMAYAQKGEVAKAIDEFEKAYELERNAIVRGFLGHAYAQDGKLDEARRIVEELEELSKRIYVPDFSIGLIHTALGQKTEAFERFEKAFAAHNEWMNWWKVAPELDILRSDPRFTAMLIRLNLTPNEESQNDAKGVG